MITFYKKYTKGVLLALIAIVAAVMILNLSYFFYGSLESYPTKEQYEDTKLLSGLVFFILLLIEAALVNKYRKLFA